MESMAVYPKSYWKKVSRKQTKQGPKDYVYYTCKVYDPKSRKTYYVTAKRKKDCQRKAEALVDRLNEGLVAGSDCPLFGSEVARYLSKRRLSWTPREGKNQQSYLNHFRSLNFREISEITSADIRGVLAGMARGQGMRAGKPASRALLQKCKAAASQLWDDFVERRLATRNVVDFVTLPRSWGVPQQDRQPLSDAQIRWILETPDPCQSLAMVMTFAGLRTSEACALRRKDVVYDSEDPKAPRYILVRQTMDLSTGQRKSQLKTKAGYRKIPMSQTLYQFVCQQLQSEVQPSDESFCFPDEPRMTAQRLRTLWNRYQKHLDRIYGTPEKARTRISATSLTFTTYQCRHTFCTLCYEAGLDVPTTAYLMGHSDLRMTENVYTHLRDSQKQKELTKLQDLHWQPV